MIELIKLNEIESVVEIFDDVKTGMNHKGINQWDFIYPNEKILEMDIIEGNAYGYYNKNEIIAYVSINESFDKEYETVNWHYIDNNPLIIHRLAVKSSAQGKGIAKKLISFVEDKAKFNGYKTIRLDAFSSNPNALGLYKSLGYRYAGDVNLRKGVFHCFEKILSK
ncbi:GNAT family N-acetyltransferase [Yeosuana marina]|uniref:GNAT family N-acetyltransferase n=1 Tax=Yeosuana marina TaxID=1565536 RepID=UPI00141D9E5A|nr:GNAT family N-acetyltransferase [Yeosuana marina]